MKACAEEKRIAGAAFSGVIRTADIATNNTVTSDKLADAKISYSGKGAVDSSNRMGWLARFFNSPFSPF